jgi:FkbM family methyltransferase
MNPRFKKFFRSIQVLFPGAEDAKFAAHDWVHRRIGRIYKQELKGLRHFDFRHKLLLDVGANRGQSIVAFKNAAPGCRVIAFEPNRMLADRLITRYADDRNVQIEFCALSNQPGTVTLYVPSYRNFLFDGLASIDPEVDKWFDRHRFYFFNPERVSIQTSIVPTRTLDSYELVPALIKLHAQRAEILILGGAKKTIARYRPVIIAAWVWDEEIAVLRALEYAPYVYKGDFFHAGAGGEFTWFFLPEHIDSLRHVRVGSRQGRLL